MSYYFKYHAARSFCLVRIWERKCLFFNVDVLLNLLFLSVGTLRILTAVIQPLIFSICLFSSWKKKNFSHSQWRRQCNSNRFQNASSFTQTKSDFTFHILTDRCLLWSILRFSFHPLVVPKMWDHLPNHLSVARRIALWRWPCVTSCTWVWLTSRISWTAVSSSGAHGMWLRHEKEKIKIAAPKIESNKT